MGESASQMKSNKLRPSMMTVIVLLMLLSSAIGHYFFSRAISHSLEQSVINSSEANISDLARLFVNEIDELQQLDPNARNQLDRLSEKDLQGLDRQIRRLLLGTDVLKAKIYNLRGVTLYSSDPKQIGASYIDSPNFQHALKGRATSVVELRAEFSGYSGTVYNRDVVSAYVPIRAALTDQASGASTIIGVAELYVDRTDEIERVRSDALELSFMLALGLLVLLLIVSISIWVLSVSLTEKALASTEKSS